MCSHNTSYCISVASTETCVTLWHHRLGHMSEKGMQILHLRNLLPDLKQVSLDFVRSMFMENRRELDFSGLGNKRIVKS